MCSQNVFQMGKADRLYCQIVRLYVYCPKETIEHIIQVPVLVSTKSVTYIVTVYALNRVVFPRVAGAAHF